MERAPRYDRDGAFAGLAIGLCFAAQYAGGKMATLAGLAAVVAVLYCNKSFFRTCCGNACEASPYCLIALALCVANIAVLGLQAHKEGMHLLNVASQVALGLAIVSVVCIYFFRELTPNLSALMAIAIGIAVLAGADLVAENLGFAKDELLDRETLFPFNFEEGLFR